VIVLTKLDLAEDADAAIAEVESVAIGVPVHPVSAVTGEGLEELEPYLGPGRTVVLLGSSGVGKSTLVNALLGEERQATKEIRAFDGRGRHTTTARELIALPGGGLVLDTPGVRELQLWDAGEGMAGTFADVDELALTCRFSDCSHESEPGCAVRDAVDHDRLESWRKLGRELRHLELKQDARARSEARKEWRRFTKSMRKSAW
jgi:ribosome biogenesis GTPase